MDKGPVHGGMGPLIMLCAEKGCRREEEYVIMEKEKERKVRI